MAAPQGPDPDTRKRILAAACVEFGAHGFAATTVDRIARRARVNKAMIYYHFPSKRALYTCIIRDVFAPIADALRAAHGRRRAARQETRAADRGARAIGRRIDLLPARFFFARLPTAARTWARRSSRSWPASSPP